MTNDWIYCVKAFCDGSKTENLCMEYKTKTSAKKCFDKRVKSMCYEKVQLVLQNAVYFAETALVLEEYHNERKTA